MIVKRNIAPTKQNPVRVQYFFEAVVTCLRCGSHNMAEKWYQGIIFASQIFLFPISSSYCCL